MPWVTEQSQENEKHLEDAWSAEIIQAAPFGLNLKQHQLTSRYMIQKKSLFFYATTFWDGVLCGSVSQ